MATDGVYKLDDEDSCLSNCFPVRSLFRPSKEGAGHWLVAHRNAIEEKYKCRICSVEESVVSGSTKLQDLGEADINCNALDGSLLMMLHHVDTPSQLCSVNISDLKLHLAKPEDFEEFDNVAYINASENFLDLEHFSRFPILRELDLSLNGIHSLRVNAGDFPYLETLDLSYNHLLSEDILSIGLLPHLKILHLSGNELQALPENMASAHHDSNQWKTEQDVLFKSLKILMLDNNKLRSPGVFNSLANLKRLQYLNLQGNYITEVPYLQQLLDERDLKRCNKQHFADLGHENGLSSDSEMLATSNGSEERTDRNSPRRWKELNKWGTSDCTHQRMYSTLEISSEFHLPLPELKSLNLADNKIAAEESLLAVAWFPSLTELVIHSNPLTTQRRGDPPMLTDFLHDRLGINIRRQKMQHMVKHRIVIPVNPKRKVETNIRRVSKLPLSLEGNGSPFLHSNTSIPEKRTDGSLSETAALESANVQFSASLDIDDGSGTACSGQEAKDSSRGDNLERDAFFITEMNDLVESACQGESEQQEPDQQREEDLIPEKFKGYEILLDAKPDASTFEPVGIQQTVRVLELALKNLLVYRDSKANLDPLHKRYADKEKRIAEPGLAKPRRGKGEKAEDALTKIKDRKTVLKAPLDRVLIDRNLFKEEYEEAHTLLKDVRRKYKMVQMKAAEVGVEVDCSEHPNIKGSTENQE